MVSRPAIEIVLDHTCLLAEGPVWDDVQELICWVDILNGELYQFSPHSKKQTTIALHQMIGAFALCSDGNLIVVLQNGFAFVDRTNGSIKMISDPEIHLTGNRFNDGKCDPGGRFWAGTMSLLETPEVGAVYMMDNDLTVTQKIPSVSISNGMAWSMDGTVFYFIDSPARCVDAYDFDVKSGQISNRRIVVQVPEADGFPDGMTIDEEGMLWIAHWGGWQVARWNPANGEKLFSFKLPVEKITSCTFGGDELKDMYITSAKVGLSETESKEQPLAGSLFVINNCGYVGQPAVKFRHNKKL